MSAPQALPGLDQLRQTESRAAHGSDMNQAWIKCGPDVSTFGGVCGI
jgi:hypothetical protein